MNKCPKINSLLELLGLSQSTSHLLKYFFTK